MAPRIGSIRRVLRTSRARGSAGQRAAPQAASASGAGSTKHRRRSIAFRQVLLRPWRLGLLVGMGALVWVVVTDATGWWRVLGVGLFLVAAAALLTLWLDPELEATDGPPRTEEEPSGTESDTADAASTASLPGQRRPSSEQ